MTMRCVRGGLDFGNVAHSGFAPFIQFVLGAVAEVFGEAVLDCQTHFFFGGFFVLGVMKDHAGVVGGFGGLWSVGVFVQDGLVLGQSGVGLVVFPVQIREVQSCAEGGFVAWKSIDDFGIPLDCFTAVDDFIVVSCEPVHGIDGTVGGRRIQGRAFG